MTSFSRKAKAEAAKYQHQIHPKHRHKYTFASDCGAGSQGNKGFQPGNTCGGDGDGKNDAGDQGGRDRHVSAEAFKLLEMAEEAGVLKDDDYTKYEEMFHDGDYEKMITELEDMIGEDPLAAEDAAAQEYDERAGLQKHIENAVTGDDFFRSAMDSDDPVVAQQAQILFDELHAEGYSHHGAMSEDDKEVVVSMLAELVENQRPEAEAVIDQDEVAESLKRAKRVLREMRQAEDLDSIEDPLAAEDAGDMLDVYETMSVDEIGDSEKKAIKDAATQLFEDGETIHEVSAKLETHPDVIGELVDLDVVAQADDAGEEAEALAEEDYLADLSESELEEVLGPGSRREEIEQQLANNPEMSDEEVNEAVQELRSIRTEEVRNAIQGGPDYSELNAQIASMSQGNATEQDLGQLKDDLSNIAYQNQGKLSAAIQGEGKRNDESIMGQYRAYQDLVDGMEIQSVEDLQRYSDLTSKAFNDLYNSIYGIPSAAPEDRG